MAPSSPTEPEPHMDLFAFIVMGLKLAVETLIFFAVGPLTLLASITTTLGVIGLIVRVVCAYTEAIIINIYRDVHEWLHPNKYKKNEREDMADYMAQWTRPASVASTDSNSGTDTCDTPSTSSPSSRSFPPVKHYLNPNDVGPRRRRSTTVATAPRLHERDDWHITVLATGSENGRLAEYAGPPPSWFNRQWREVPRVTLTVPPRTPEEVEAPSSLMIAH
ncbi:hypothetical protein C7999DRAFT_33208 [Corynascus novoguineensis]|uniref:Uncharacterized protein n=1 Tax=Corynascus novoguineensis TaxID=1126955 RepID=A0AAN7CQD2_9PEZI|nr:hypothetical protein C7999DRAFT_33208 [Corynascus novoguineensis]